MDDWKHLQSYLEMLGSATIAFSGGVDSTFLSRVAFDALKDKAKAVTVVTEFTSKRDVREAKESAEWIGINHEIINISVLDEEEITDNPADRCYHCKKIIMSEIHGQNLMDGTNASDDRSRPGLKALKEKGVISPMLELGITKEEIRANLKKMGYPHWDKPTNSCLATRITTDQKIEKSMLRKIELVEEIIHRLGFTNVRARIKGNRLMIEVPEMDQETLDKSMDSISSEITPFGFDDIMIGIKKDGS